MIILKITPIKNKNETKPAFAARFFLSNPFLPTSFATSLPNTHVSKTPRRGHKVSPLCLNLGGNGDELASLFFAPSFPLHCILHCIQADGSFRGCFSDSLSPQHFFSGSDWSIQAPGNEPAVRQKRDCSWQRAANKAGSWHAAWKTVLTAYATVIFRLMTHFIC